MSKKGFTLVELLAVIVILAVVMLIGSVSISSIRLKMNESMFETKLELVISSAKNYGQDNKDDLNATSGKSTTVTVNDLIVSKDLETEDTLRGAACTNMGYPSAGTDPSTGEALCYVVVDDTSGQAINSLVIKVYIKNNRIYACIPRENNNLVVIDDLDESKYGNLNYYC